MALRKEPTDPRKLRLAKALKANIARRKLQARLRASTAAAPPKPEKQ